MRFVIKNAAFYQAVTNILQFLEAQVSAESYTLMDDGETLEICSQTLAQCRQSNEWHKLERQYSQVGGDICSPDDDWECEVV